MSFEELNERNKAYREQGLCPACGAQPVQGRTYCYEHLRYFRTRIKSKRARRKAEGLCTTCGEPVTTHVECQTCRDKRNARRNNKANAAKQRALYHKRKAAWQCPGCKAKVDSTKEVRCESCRNKRNQKKSQP